MGTHLRPPYPTFTQEVLGGFFMILCGTMVKKERKNLSGRCFGGMNYPRKLWLKENCANYGSLR